MLGNWFEVAGLFCKNLLKGIIFFFYLTKQGQNHKHGLCSSNIKKKKTLDNKIFRIHSHFFFHLVPLV